MARRLQGTTELIAAALQLQPQQISSSAEEGNSTEFDPENDELANQIKVFEAGTFVQPDTIAKAQPALTPDQLNELFRFEGVSSTDAPT